MHGIHYRKKIRRLSRENNKYAYLGVLFLFSRLFLLTGGTLNEFIYQPGVFQKKFTGA